MLAATHRAGHADITDLASAPGRALSETVFEVARELTQAILRDGDGATKFITVNLQGGRSEAECRFAAYAIAHSPSLCRGNPYAPTSTASVCTRRCGSIRTTASGWSICAATSPGRRCPTSAFTSTPPGMWS